MERKKNCEEREITKPKKIIFSVLTKKNSQFLEAFVCSSTCVTDLMMPFFL